MSEETRYTDQLAEQILVQAAKLGVGGDGMTKEQLLATAAELGISPQAVEAAEKHVVQQQEAEAERQEYKEHVRRSNMREIGQWMSVSVFLFGINFLTSGLQLKGMWCVWPIGIWALFLLANIIETAFKTPTKDEASFQRWRERKHRFGAHRAMELKDIDHEEWLDEYIVNKKRINKIKMIKDLREETGLSLSEAKQTVDSYVTRNGLEV